MRIFGQFAISRSVIFIALCLPTAIVLPAQTFTVLHSFQGGDGSAPNSDLVQGTDGSFYGTTNYGGSSPNCDSLGPGCGTVFKITTTGTMTTLHSFCPRRNCKDGAYPFAGLVQGTDGKFYGTTSAGGSANNAGTVFRMTNSGQLKTIYAFCPQSKCTDGSTPVAGLIEGSDGNFYGVTQTGGANGEDSGICAFNVPPDSGCGTVFRITPKGGFTTLYSFCAQPNCADGYLPVANLVQAADGNLYGTTSQGGPERGGTIFQITPAGELTTVYGFCPKGDCAGGMSPNALVPGSDGKFYGSTVSGGNPQGSGGTVFNLTTKGKLTTLYTFCALPECRDGLAPMGSLVQATDGIFYGVTGYGGTYEAGGIFSINAGGSFNLLYPFCSQDSCTDGAYPLAGLVQGTDGSFYGVATMGGNSPVYCNSWDTWCGTVFNFSVGLGAFVATRPISGTIGQKVVILGNDLTGTTSVEFNGAAAKFKVVSGSEITVKIPKGATTGFVTVTTPNGTLTSNVQFVVQ